MNLSSMVVSRDWPEVSVLECILGGMQITVDVEPRPERARAKLAKSKIDALIVDCDLEGGSSVLESAFTGKIPNSIAVAMSGSSSKLSRPGSGGQLTLRKPISVEQAVVTMSAARNQILNWRLRYHRSALNLPASLLADNKRIDASLLNLSQGGAGVKLKRALPENSELRLNFALPSAAGKIPVQVCAEVAWMDKRGNAGIRFTSIPAPMKKDLQLWLEQQYFAG